MRSLARAIPCLLAVLAAVPAYAQPTSAAAAFQAAYDLDLDVARARFAQGIAARPDDVVAHRGMATVAWLAIASRRGTVTADEFLGTSGRGRLDLPRPPADLAALFRAHATRALELADVAVRRRPRDPEALYELGAAVGLQASYMATIEGRVWAALRAARRAYDAHERVLALDARRKDAGLTVGTYRYLVSTLPAPGRWMAYIAGFGGGRERGLQMVEQAAAHPGAAQTEALFALVLIYNREARYDDALRVLAQLRERYPRNRLLWLESAATALRARRLAEADRFLAEGFARLRGDTRPRAHGEDALWQYTLGAVRLAERKLPAAADAYAAAARGEARGWVRARTHLGLGKLADLAGERARATREYNTAVQLGLASRDPGTVSEARRLLRDRFR